jgi:hypothetical protein
MKTKTSNSFSETLIEHIKGRFVNSGVDFFLSIYATIAIAAILSFVALLVTQGALHKEAFLCLVTTFGTAVGFVFGVSWIASTSGLTPWIENYFDPRPGIRVLKVFKRELCKEIQYRRQTTGKDTKPIVKFRIMWITFCKSWALLGKAIVLNAFLFDDKKLGDLKKSQKSIVVTINKLNALFQNDYADLQHVARSLDEIYNKVSRLSEKFIKDLCHEVETEIESISSTDVIELIEEQLANINTAIKNKNGRELCELSRIALGITTILADFFPHALTFTIINNVIEHFGEALGYVDTELKRGNDPDKCYALYKSNIEDRLKALRRLQPIIKQKEAA